MMREVIHLSSNKREMLVDITDQVKAVVRKSEIKSCLLELKD